MEEIEHCAATYGYKGFKVSVPAEVVNLVMQPEKWPTHVSVKKILPAQRDQAAGQPRGRTKTGAQH